jgi:hypothetical protein
MPISSTRYLCALLLAGASFASAQNLVYYGGEVVSSPQYVMVLYGTGSYDGSVTGGGTSLSSLLSQINSAYSWLSTEYSTVNPSPAASPSTKSNQILVGGKYVGRFTIAPSSANNGTTIDDTQIQSELQSQIAAGHLPPPAYDALGYGVTIYIVFFPHGKTITQGGSASCQLFCAYHGTIKPSVGNDYYYAVMPDMQPGSGCELGCGGGSTSQNYMSVLSHELAETITDAGIGLASTNAPPLAWYDNTNGEIADICNGIQTNFTGTDGIVYTVQSLWSNAKHACIGPQSSVTPLVNNFSLSSSASSLTITAGGTGSTATISSKVTAGNPETVNLTVSGLPSGVFSSFNPNSITSGNSSVLSLGASSLATPGTYTLTVTGTNTTGYSTATPDPDFSIAAAPSPISLAKGSGVSLAVSTAAINTPESLTLSVSGLPNGVTATFSPSTLSSGQAATLYLLASNSASLGAVTVTVSGSAASGSRTVPVALTVVPPGAAAAGVDNGGFERGDLTAWTPSGVASVVAAGPHSGTFAVLLGSALPSNGDSSISQTFLAPPAAGQLSFWYNIHCLSPGYDWATATLRDNTLGLTSIVLPNTCTNTGQWANLTVPVTGGHSYTLTLTNHDDRYPGDATFALFDDVGVGPATGAPVTANPVWKQIGAPEPPDTNPPAHAKPRFHGTAYTPVAYSPAAAAPLNDSTANTVTLTLNVIGTAAISISNLPSTAAYGNRFTPAYNYSGDGTPSVTTNTPSVCTIAGSDVYFADLGTCSLTAHAAAGATSPAVDGTPQTFTIGQATTAISISNIPSSAVYGGSFTPSFTYLGDGAKSVTSSTSTTCAVSGGAVSFAGPGTCTLTAHAAAGTYFKAVDGTPQSFTIAQATATISVSNVPANAVYGGSFTPTFAYNGDGTTSVTSGTTAVCTVSGTAVSFVGIGACTLNAHATAGINYKAVDGTPQSFTIGQATPTLSISNIPLNAVYGGSFAPAFAYNGDGTASVTSTTATCTVSGGQVSFVGAGVCTLTAHGGNGTNYTAVDGARQSFTIGQATPTLSVSNIPLNAVYGGSFTPAFAYNGDGTASVVSGATATCTVSGGVVSFVGAGPCVLTAHATAGTNYKAGDGTPQSFTIGQATPNLSISNIPANAVYGGSFTPALFYNGDGMTSVSSTTAACTVSGGIVSFVGAGTCTLTAHATAGTNYKAADGALQSFTIGQATTAISIGNLPSNAVYTASFIPTFAYNGDGATSVTSATPGACSVSGPSVSFVGTGTCTLTAHASTGVNYKATDGAPQSFTVHQRPTTLVLTGPSSVVFGFCTATFKAVLSDTLSSAGIAGQTVAFNIGTQTGTAVTDATGTATFMVPMNQNVGTIAASTAFAGTATLAAAASNALSVAITPATAGPQPGNTLYTGSSLFWTAGTNSNTATLTLSATVQDAAGLSCADIRTAKVTFGFRNSDGSITPISGAQNLPVGLVSPSDATTGTASAVVQYKIGGANIDQLQIAVLLGGNYTLNSELDDTLITVAVPGQANQMFVNGGLDLLSGPAGSGYLDSAPGAIPAGAAGYLQVQANLSWNKNLTNPKGGATLIVNTYNKPDGTLDTALHTYLIRSTSIAGLTATVPGSVVQFTAKAVVQDVTNPAAAVGVDGGCTLQLTATNPTIADPNGQLNVSVIGNKNNLWIADGWNGAQPVNKPLVTGTVLVQ